MADKIKKNLEIKTKTFSGRTDNTGNIKVATGHLYAVGVRFTESALTGYCFIYNNGDTYLRVLSNANVLLLNTDVAGTIYYIE